MIERKHAVRSTKTMLLGLLIALLGVGFAQPGDNYYLFRNFYFIPEDLLLNYLPVASILLIVVGVSVGIVGYFQNQ